MVEERGGIMDNTTSLINDANQCIAQGKFNQAATILEQALAINPKNPVILEALGNTYFKLVNLKKAKDFFEQCLKVTSSPLTSLIQLIQIGMQSLDYDCADKYLTELEKVAPENFLLGFYSAKLAAIQCDWEKVNCYRERLDSHNKFVINGNKNLPLEFPLSLTTRTMDIDYIFQLTKHYCALQLDALTKQAYSNYSTFKKKNKIRIGYVSDDICNHPVGHLIYQLFQHHDREKFEFYLYAYNIKPDDIYYQAAIKGCDHIIDITQLKHEVAAKKIHDDNIDILIDLKGHTTNNRLAIFAYKPAPIQITYLGYPGTTGATFMDYIIADKIIIPKDQQQYYTEQVLYLPQCYQANPKQRIVSDKIFKKSDFNIPDNKFVFACFNWSYKIEEQLFTTWCDILKEVPSSILWLLETNKKTKTNLLTTAHKHGVDKNRIYFAPLANKPEHLARMKLVDLMLDTYTCNGHTTTSDALYIGVPVLTCTGKHFASRVATSILTAAGLPNLIANDLQDYKNKAIAFAHNPTSMHIDSSLFNPALICKQLENIFIKIISSR